MRLHRWGKTMLMLFLVGYILVCKFCFSGEKKNATTYFNYQSFLKGTAKTGNVARKKQLVLTFKKVELLQNIPLSEEWINWI